MNQPYMAGGTEAGATDKDGCQRSKRSALSLTVGYLECATTPEISEKLNETVYTTNLVHGQVDVKMAAV